MKDLVLKTRLDTRDEKETFNFKELTVKGWKIYNP